MGNRLQYCSVYQRLSPRLTRDPTYCTQRWESWLFSLLGRWRECGEPRNLYFLLTWSPSTPTLSPLGLELLPPQLSFHMTFGTNMMP